MAKKVKVGIIGFGNMGSALAKQLIKKGYQVFVFDRDIKKTKNLSSIIVTLDNLSLVKEVQVVILAVKPQDFEIVLREIKAGLKTQLIISIAAGITTTYIENLLGKVKIIRVMPNMPAQIGKGILGLCKGRFATLEDVNLAKEILSSTGKVFVFEEEEMLDKVTAISGSGPAYLCYYIIKNKKNNFIEKLKEAAKNIGFSQDLAEEFSQVTTEGTLALLKEKNLSPEELIKKVASKGGTTEAALKVLEEGGSLEEAVKAALRRSKELVKG